MSLTATLPSSGSSVSSLTSTTSIALTEIFVCAAIAISVLIFVLAVTDMTSRSDFRNANTMAALRAISVPLIVTFCAWFLFEAATNNWL